jgi:hypothetical protein
MGSTAEMSEALRFEVRAVGSFVRQPGCPGQSRGGLRRRASSDSAGARAANLRSERDATGLSVRTSPCHGDFRSDFDADCLAPVQERAWSSPVFPDQPRS